VICLTLLPTCAFCAWTPYSRGGQLIFFGSGATLTRSRLVEGHTFQWKQKSVVILASGHKLEEILGLKIFHECFRGPRKTTWRAIFGPRAANCPPLLYRIVAVRRSIVSRFCSKSQEFKSCMLQHVTVTINVWLLFLQQIIDETWSTRTESHCILFPWISQHYFQRFVKSKCVIVKHSSITWNDNKRVRK